MHAVFGSGVQCFGPVIYQALCTSMLGKELSTGVVNMGLGEPGPRPSYVPAEVSPVPEGYVPSAIDASAQQQKWGSRIGGEHHGAELWHLYSTLAAPLASCCLLQRRRRLGCGSSKCRWLIPAIYTSLIYEHKCLPSNLAHRIDAALGARSLLAAARGPGVPARRGGSADSQTASRGRTDFFRLNYSGHQGYVLLDLTELSSYLPSVSCFGFGNAFSILFPCTEGRVRTRMTSAGTPRAGAFNPA